LTQEQSQLFHEKKKGEKGARVFGTHDDRRTHGDPGDSGERKRGGRVRRGVP